MSPGPHSIMTLGQPRFVLCKDMASCDLSSQLSQAPPPSSCELLCGVTVYQHQPFAPSVPLGWFFKETKKPLLLFLWGSYRELCVSNSQITPWALGDGYWDSVQVKGTSSLSLHLTNKSQHMLLGCWDSEITLHRSSGSLEARPCLHLSVYTKHQVQRKISF